MAKPLKHRMGWGAGGANARGRAEKAQVKIKNAELLCEKQKKTKTE